MPASPADPLAAIAADPGPLVADLLARAEAELTAAEIIVEQGRLDGYTRKLGSAVESLRLARYALDIASALSPSARNSAR